MRLGVSCSFLRLAPPIGATVPVDTIPTQHPSGNCSHSLLGCALASPKRCFVPRCCPGSFADPRFMKLARDHKRNMYIHLRMYSDEQGPTQERDKAWERQSKL